MEQMTAQEIFQKCPEINRFGHDWKEVYAKVFALVSKTDKFRLMRCGNSIFLIMIKEPHQAEICMFNADPPKKFARNFKEFAKAMEVAGYKSVSGVTDNLPTLKMLEHFGYPIKIENIGVDDKGNAQYRGTIDV
jgi:hypothetical protein